MMLFNHVPISPLSIPPLFSSPLYSLSHLYISAQVAPLFWAIHFVCVCVCVIEVTPLVQNVHDILLLSVLK
jgi:hypothetical protein